MLSVVLRRLAIGVPVVIGTTIVLFVVLHVLPGDPVAAILAGAPASRATIDHLRQQLGLNAPLVSQYWQFVTHAVRGDLGRSYTNDQPVTTVIAQAIGPTLVLTVSSLAFGLVVGVLGGIASAVWRGTWVDALLRLLSLFGAAMPVFWSGVLLLLLFSFTLHWFPAVGGTGLRALVLPTVSLGLGAAGLLVRVVRNSMLDVMGEPFVGALRAKGLSEWRVVGHHVVRNALIPAVTLLGLQVGQALAGAVITETIFSRPGVGRVLVSAIEAQDYPVVQGIMLVLAVGYVLVNIVIDVSYAFIDPRIRTTVDGAG